MSKKLLTWIFWPVFWILNLYKYFPNSKSHHQLTKKKWHAKQVGLLSIVPIVMKMANMWKISHILCIRDQWISIYILWSFFSCCGKAQKSILHIIKYLLYSSKSKFKARNTNVREDLGSIVYKDLFSLTFENDPTQMSRHSPVNTHWHLFIHFFLYLYIFRRTKMNAVVFTKEPFINYVTKNCNNFTETSYRYN